MMRITVWQAHRADNKSLKALETDLKLFLAVIMNQSGWFMRIREIRFDHRPRPDENAGCEIKIETFTDDGAVELDKVWLVLIAHWAHIRFMTGKPASVVFSGGFGSTYVTYPEARRAGRHTFESAHHRQEEAAKQ